LQGENRLMLAFLGGFGIEHLFNPEKITGFAVLGLFGAGLLHVF